MQLSCLFSVADDDAGESASRLRSAAAEVFVGVGDDDACVP